MLNSHFTLQLSHVSLFSLTHASYANSMLRSAEFSGRTQDMEAIWNILDLCTKFLNGVHYSILLLFKKKNYL